MAVSRICTRPRNTSPAHLTRVRTIRIGFPQQVQFTTGRGLGGGTTTCLISCTSLNSLLLGCRKPKLRARLNPFGRIPLVRQAIINHITDLFSPSPQPTILSPNIGHSSRKHKDYQGF
jgi:hypothetical protein